MPYDLPSTVAKYEEVREAEIKPTGVTLVGSLQVLDTCNHGSFAIDAHFHLCIGDYRRFHITGGEHLKILCARRLCAVHVADCKFLGVEVFKEREVSFLASFCPILLELHECLFV